MGKSSLPILNKTGRTIAWDNSWDDLKYYNIKFEEDIFIKIFFDLFFNEHLFKHNFFLKKFYLNKLKFFYLDSYTYLNEYFDDFRPFILSLIKPSKIIFYFMKFHILRVNSSIILILKLFFPIRRKKKKITKKLRKKKNLIKTFRVLKLISLFLNEKTTLFKKKNF